MVMIALSRPQNRKQILSLITLPVYYYEYNNNKIDLGGTIKGQASSRERANMYLNDTWTPLKRQSVRGQSTSIKILSFTYHIQYSTLISIEYGIFIRKGIKQPTYIHLKMIK